MAFCKERLGSNIERVIQAYRDTDANCSLLEGKKIAILGYGSQGRAQALNLRDSGCEVIVGVREGPSRDLAITEGFTAGEITQTASSADVLVFCLPDVEMGRIFEKELRTYLRSDVTLIFAHGFSIHYDLVKPDAGHDVILVAPMGAGPIVRSRYEQGSGVPALLAVSQDASGKAWEMAKAYGSAIGCGRVAMLKTTFREETESDLFGEQAVLCGGLPVLMMTAYETLVKGGVAPEIAYIACVQEVKLIADLIYEKGLDGMAENISSTAEWGAYEASSKLPKEALKNSLEQIWNDVHSGRFARNWVDEESKGAPNLVENRKRFVANPIHSAGRVIRKMFGIEKS